MKKRNIAKVLALALCCTMAFGLVAGCGGGGTTSQGGAGANSSANSGGSGSTGGTPAAAKDTLVFGSNAAASGVFHPTLQYSNNDREVVFLVYDRLVTKNAAGEYVPSLREKYEVNADSTTYTFYLKQGIKWQDGEDFTAEDVAYTYETTCHADFGKGYDEFSAALLGADAYHEGSADHVEGIQVIDEYTVSFTFKAPYMDAMVKFIDKPVLAKHVWETVEVGAWGDATELLKNPVGTGPYKVIEFVPDQYVRLEANPNYFKGEPKIKYFIFKVSNKDTRQAEVIKGDIDLTEVTSWRPDGIQAYQENNIPMGEQPDTNARYLVFDTTDSRLSDVRVRQAIIYSLDRQAMVDGLCAGHGSLSNALMQPTQPAYPKDGLNLYEYNPEKAKELLAEAGWVDSNNDGIVEKNGENLHLTFQYSGNDQLAQVLQQFTKAVGIDVELVSQDFNTVLSTLRTPTEEFDMALMGATYRPNPGYGGSNTWMARFDKDPREMELLAAAAAAGNEEEAKANYKAWCQYINEQVPMFIMYFESQGYAYNPKLVNYETIKDEWFANVETWYFEP